MSKKTIFPFASLITVIISLSLTGCSMNTGGGGGTPAVNKSIVLKDANGVVLGYVTSSSYVGVSIFTPTNYFVSLTWKGVLQDGFCYCTAANGAGTLFIMGALNSAFYGYSTSIGGQPYIAASVDTSGFAISDSSITGYQSYYSSGSFINGSSTVPTSVAAYPLKAATLADIGIPSSIALPMQLLFQ